VSESFALKKIAIIPVYRDMSSILSVLAKFKKGVVDEICVVIDCGDREDISRIEEAAEKSETRAHLILNCERKGIGYALREGIDYALQKNYNVAVIMAGNGKDNPQEIPRLLQPILEEGYDYVQGSRFLPGGKAVRNPFFRKIFSRLYPFLWTLITGVTCTDVTNGFRAHRLGIFSDSRINIRQGWLDSYEMEYYLHFKILTSGYRTKEVPVSKTYPYNHKGGYSLISPFRDWWKIVGTLVYLVLGMKE